MPDSSVVAVSEMSAAAISASYSGDDAYDPAAGGAPEQSVTTLAADVSSLVACSPSAGEIEARSAWTTDGGFGGDDDYDPAAGGAPELSLFAFVTDASLALACAPVAPSS